MALASIPTFLQSIFSRRSNHHLPVVDQLDRPGVPFTTHQHQQPAISLSKTISPITLYSNDEPTRTVLMQISEAGPSTLPLFNNLVNSSSIKTFNAGSQSSHHPHIGSTGNKGVSSQYNVNVTIDSLNARERVRGNGCPCRWRTPKPCSALLASHALLTKHLHMHVERTDAPHTCAWQRCQMSFASTRQLGEHVNKVHLEPAADLYCPFKDCRDRYIRPTLLVSHYDSHPQPWTEDQLSPVATSKPVLTQVAATPPHLPDSDLPPYLLTVDVINPYRPQPAMTLGIVPNQSATRSQFPRLTDIRYPIVPEYEDHPFVPTCGEPLVGYTIGASSSIFPTNKTYDNERPLSLERDAQGQLIIPSTFVGEGSDARPLTVRKKADGPNRPRLVLPPHIFASGRNEVQFAERKRKRKGKDKMVEQDREGTEKTFNKEKIRRTALRVAAKKVGRSVGIDFWKEVLDFEAEGRVLDEMAKRPKVQSRDDTIL